MLLMMRPRSAVDSRRTELIHEYWREWGIDGEAHQNRRRHAGQAARVERKELEAGWDGPHCQADLGEDHENLLSAPAVSH